MNLSKITWSVELVEEWLQIAAQVDRAMPAVKPQGYMSYSLMVMRTELENLQAEPDDKPRFKPTSMQITMWEIVSLQWLNMIDSAENKKIVWLRSSGMGWVRLAKKFHLSRQTVANRYEKTIKKLAEQINKSTF